MVLVLEIPQNNNVDFFAWYMGRHGSKDKKLVPPAETHPQKRHFWHNGRMLCGEKGDPKSRELPPFASAHTL